VNLVLFSGIPGSGKSTFYKEIFYDTHVRVNLDMLKTRNREEKLIHCCLQSLQPFVIDNTNLTKADRQKYIEAARECRFKVKGYFFVPVMKEAMERNNLRSGKKKVPEKAILSMKKKIQPMEYGEGFDEIYEVRLNGNKYEVVKREK
jgi:predicted kinase